MWFAALCISAMVAAAFAEITHRAGAKLYVAIWLGLCAWFGQVVVGLLIAGFATRSYGPSDDRPAYVILTIAGLCAAWLWRNWFWHRRS